MHKEFVTVAGFWRFLPDTIHAHTKVQHVPVGRCISNTVNIEKLPGLLAGAID